MPKKYEITFKSKVRREFMKIRKHLVSKMLEKRYSVKEIAETLAATEHQIYHDMRKINTENYLEGKR